MKITDTELCATLGIGPAGPADDTWLTRCVDATNALVARWRPDIPTAGTTITDYPDVHAGALALAAKLYRTRGGSDDAGATPDLYTYAARLVDANTAMLLGIDGPVIG